MWLWHVASNSICSTLWDQKREVFRGKWLRSGFKKRAPRVVEKGARGNDNARPCLHLSIANSIYSQYIHFLFWQTVSPRDDKKAAESKINRLIRGPERRCLTANPKRREWFSGETQSLVNNSVNQADEKKVAVRMRAMLISIVESAFKTLLSPERSASTLELSPQAEHKSHDRILHCIEIISAVKRAV